MKAMLATTFADRVGDGERPVDVTFLVEDRLWVGVVAWRREAPGEGWRRVHNAHSLTDEERLAYVALKLGGEWP